MTGRAAALETASKLRAAEGLNAVLIDLPNAGQAAVVVGAPGIPRSATEYFAGTVANAFINRSLVSLLMDLFFHIFVNLTMTIIPMASLDFTSLAPLASFVILQL